MNPHKIGEYLYCQYDWRLIQEKKNQILRKLNQVLKNRKNRSERKRLKVHYPKKTDWWMNPSPWNQTKSKIQNVREKLTSQASEKPPTQNLYLLKWFLPVNRPSNKRFWGLPHTSGRLFLRDSFYSQYKSPALRGGLPFQDDPFTMQLLFVAIYL